jgi:DHA1 family tetracycline resistance protein-like MFS transporter
VQGTLVGPLVRRYGERRVLLAGLLAGATGFLVYALAPTGPLFVAGIPVVALWGLAAPSAQGLMTRHVAANVQGELQGAMGSLQGIATVIGPVMFATIFAWSIEAGRHWHFPGAAYTLAAMLLAASATIVARATREGSAA